MAYEATNVAVPKSQESIRKLILANGGTAIGFISQPPVEGFQAQVAIDGMTYSIRISATVKVKEKARRRRRYGMPPKNDDADKATRRVWRVLYYHLKSVYEAANSGVMEFRELMLPYIVTKDGRTIGQHILPNLDQALAGKPERLLPAPKEEK